MRVPQRIVNRVKRKIVKPDPKPLHPDLIGADAALKRAARRALDRALQTGAPCWILRDGEMVDLAAEVRGQSRAKAVIKPVTAPMPRYDEDTLVQQTTADYCGK